MKKVTKELGKDLGIKALKTVKIATIGTLGLTSSIIGTTSNLIIAGCNNGVAKLKNKKTSFRKKLEEVHHYQNTFNHIVDGRLKLEEVYSEMASDDFKKFVEYMVDPFERAAMDINQARD